VSLLAGNLPITELELIMSIKILITSSYHEFVYRKMYNGVVIIIRKAGGLISSWALEPLFQYVPSL